MTKALYYAILYLHPPAFRRRFRDEMLSIFDEAKDGYFHLTLLADGLLSCVRQWVLRTGFWKFPAAIMGACIQLWGLVYRIHGYQYGNRNHDALTPYVQELMLFALALIGCLFVTVVCLVLWTAGFQRRRAERHKPRHA